MFAVLFTTSFSLLVVQCFQIRRQRNSVDVFTIPNSTCARVNESCTVYDGIRQKKDISCVCQCPMTRSTFGYMDRALKCLNNTELRTATNCLLYLPKYSMASPIPIFSSDRVGLNLSPNACNISLVRYQDDNGSWAKVAPRSMFILRKGNGTTHHLTIDNVAPVEGRVVKIQFDCKTGNMTTSPCLLLKLEGNVSSFVAFTVPPTIPTTFTSSVTSEPHNEEQDDGPNVGAIVGGVLGGVALVVIMTVIMYIACRNKREARRKSKAFAKSTKTDVYNNIHLRELDEKGTEVAIDDHYVIPMDVTDGQTSYSIVADDTTAEKADDVAEYDLPKLDTEKGSEILSKLAPGKKKKKKSKYVPSVTPLSKTKVSDAPQNEDDEYEVMQPNAVQVELNTSESSAQAQPLYGNIGQLANGGYQASPALQRAGGSQQQQSPFEREEGTQYDNGENDVNSLPERQTPGPLDDEPEYVNYSTAAKINGTDKDSQDPVYGNVPSREELRKSGSRMDDDNVPEHEDGPPVPPRSTSLSTSPTSAKCLLTPKEERAFNFENVGDDYLSPTLQDDEPTYANTFPVPPPRRKKSLE